MNWKQLYTAATPAEREELLILMLQHIEARQQKIILARGRLLRERRRKSIAHILGDRRLAPRSIPIAQIGFIFILSTLSIATWLIAVHIQPMYGAPLIFGYNLLLITILLIKPYQRQKLVAKS